MIRHIFISPKHNFFGHKGQAPGETPMVDLDEVECVAGRGLVGDRFFDFKPDYKGQSTFFAWENLLKMWDELGVTERVASVTRRNIISEGLDLNALIGAEFEIQGVRFLGTEECRPCSWMNDAVDPRAEAWMKGRGGLRAKILVGGVLKRNLA